MFPSDHDHLWICAPPVLLFYSVWTEKLFLLVRNEISFLCTVKTPSLKWTSYAFTYFLSYTNTKHMKHGHTFK